MDSTKLILECTIGYLDPANAIFGIIPEDSDIVNYCMNNNITEKCTQSLDKNKISKILNEECSDVHKCVINVDEIKKTAFTEKNGNKFVCTDSQADFFI